MKRLLAILLAVMMMFTLVACGNGGGDDSSSTPDSSGDSSSTPAPSGDGFQMALLLAQFSDTHLSNVRRNVERRIGEWDDMSVTAIDNRNDGGVMTDNLNNAIAQGFDLVATNDSNQQPDVLVEMFKNAGIPLIIWNASSPSDEALESYKDAYFVSSAAPESGAIQGEVAVEYWNANPDADRNGNGKMDYVMLQGTQGFYDTVVRTEYSIQAVVDAGIEVNIVADEIADFNRATAQDKMAAIISANKDDIEVVFANNDDMALGAIESMKAAGFFEVDPEGGFVEGTFIPVLGVDATTVGMDALVEGTLLATSLNDPVAMGEAICAIARLIANGEEVNTANLNAVGDWMPQYDFEVDPYGRVWTHYRKIVADNVDTVDLG